MHHTFVKPASAVALASFLTSVHAAVTPRQAVPSDGFTCVDDPLYKGFFSNSQISYDVNTFCVQDLGLTAATVCDHSLTARTTIYPSGTSITRTVTATSIAYDTTVTVIETGVVYDLSKKLKARNAAPAPTPEPQITAAPKYVRDKLDARVLEKRQSGFAGSSVALEVYSACECGYLAGLVDPGTSYYATCFPYTTTITANQVAYVPTTVFTTVPGLITTVTVTQNLTSNILSAISAMNTSAPTAAPSWTGSWTGPWTGPWNGSWTDWSGPPTASPSITSESVSAAPTTTSSGYSSSTTSMNSTTNTSSSMSTIMSPAASSTTSFSSTPTWTGSSNGTWTGIWNGTRTMTTSSVVSSPTVQPSGCPYINGTTYTPPGSCNVYTRVCGLSFEDQDFYGIFPYYPSPETCAQLCDADSNGMSPCLGIVWNTSATAGSHESNCRQLQSLGSPIMDSTAIALILTGMDSNCLEVVNISSSTSTMMNSTINPVSPTTTGNFSYSMPTGTGRPSYPAWNSTWSLPSGTWNYTRGYPTGTGSSHTYNRTRSHHFTGAPYKTSKSSYSNITTSMNSTSIVSINSTAGVSVGTISPIITSNSTCPVSTVTSVSTQYATLFNNATITLDRSTVTIYATNISAVTIASTETTTETDMATTVIETDTETTTETDMAATSTVTETDTETDTTTTTETDTETTTTTDMSTTITDTVTETDTVTVAATATAPPGRYGRVWRGDWRA